MRDACNNKYIVPFRNECYYFGEAGGGSTSNCTPRDYLLERRGRDRAYLTDLWIRPYPNRCISPSLSLVPDSEEFRLKKWAVKNKKNHCRRSCGPIVVRR